MTQANLNEQKHIRYYIPVLYHRAVILHKENKYSEAKILFQEVMLSAKKINWYRVINSAQNWLAEIAIEQGERDGAQQLLTKGIIVADSSKNKRRLARYKCSLAKWHRRWGSADQADKLAREAMDAFEHLGMTQDAEEMQLLLGVL